MFLVGHGGYTIGSNTVMSGDPPQFARTANGVRIQHREFIGDISGSVGFTTQLYAPLNPGVSPASSTPPFGGMFPWLAQIALAFQQYKIHGCVLEFISSSGEFNTGTTGTAALGEVFFSTNYNANANEFTNKAQMLNSEFSAVSCPTKNVTHMIECAKNQSTLDLLYVRSRITNEPPSTTPAGSIDYRFNDLGDVQVATQGQPSVYVIGSIFITYDIELLKPTGEGPSLLAASLEASAFYNMAVTRTNAILDGVIPTPGVTGIVNIGQPGNFKAGFIPASLDTISPTGVNGGLWFYQSIGADQSFFVSFIPGCVEGNYLLSLNAYMSGHFTATGAGLVVQDNSLGQLQAGLTAVWYNNAGIQTSTGPPLTSYNVVKFSNTPQHNWTSCLTDVITMADGLTVQRGYDFQEVIGLTIPQGFTGGSVRFTNVANTNGPLGVSMTGPWDCVQSGATTFQVSVAVISVDPDSTMF